MNRNALEYAMEHQYAEAPQSPVAPALPAEIKMTLLDIEQHLPSLWDSDHLTQPRRKALLRCLIDKVVVARRVREQIHARIVWQGGDSTELDIPIVVGSFTELSNGAELERRIVALARAGIDDNGIAQQLTVEGFRSPMAPTAVLASTVLTIRLKHRLLVNRHQACRRHVPGYLTITELSERLGFSNHWFYARITRKSIIIEHHAQTGLYLFPDNGDTLRRLSELKSGQCRNVVF